ncbi:penicillin acylase family protein [Paenalcaligenes sp. Me52]|uniref:penicillin acylase family protein n=1 Tax=Paenalcaligenes sp. Me52 TaxID=3392038 RepID=UPI003D27985A
MRSSALKKTAFSLSLLASALLSVAHAAPVTVEINRDAYGVPHVFADSNYGLFYGYGYAVAQDRLFQLDMARRSFVGTTAEVLGAGDNNVYLNYDINVRRNFNPESINKQLAALPEEDASIFKGYADGYNAYLAQVLKKPELLPKEYVDFDFAPTPISAFDVAMIWVGSMANRFSDVNLEMGSLSLLNDLEAKHDKAEAERIFNELLWVNDPNSPTTVPKSATEKPVSYHQPAPQQLVALSTETAQSILQDTATRWGGTGPDFVPKASNLWSTQPHRVEENATILINGPQFGWYNPSYTYGIGLHGAGFNVSGNTPFAYPIVLFGTNNQIAWGATAGPQDVVDIYQEQLNPNNPAQYRYNNEYLDIEERQETIKVKGQPDTVVTLQRTVHGPVMAVDNQNKVAYSKKRSWDGYEVQSLLAWLNIAKAQNWEDFLAQAEKMAISINWYYADKNGNIGYVSPGFLPKRPANQDMRIPALGDGSMEWEGIHDFSATPKAYNPQQGYLSNWNNRPAPDKTNTDAYYWTYGDRVNELNVQFAQKDKFTLQEIWDFNRPASYHDVNWRYFQPHLQAAANKQATNTPTHDMTALLLQWDGLETDDGNGVNVGPERLIFKTWLEEMYKLVLVPVLPEAHQASYTNTGFASTNGPNPGSINLSMGTKVLLRALDLEQNPDPQRHNFFAQKPSTEVMQQALENTYQRLKAEQGDDMANWKMSSSVHKFSDRNFTGTPQTTAGNTFSFTGYQNRGTENNRIVFYEDKVEFCDAMPPGQSGFIDRHGKKSPHYDDQLALYQNFGCKPVSSTVDDIKATTVESTVLIVEN